MADRQLADRHVTDGITVREIGFVTRFPLPASPRVAVLPDGRLVASFVGRSGAGTPDYALFVTSSEDGGRTWQGERPVWPEDAGRWSLAGSIAAGVAGELVLFGTQTPVSAGDGSWWDPERGALAANELFWSRSEDGGATWSARRVIPMADPAAAEAPGPMLVTRGGGRLVCYAPYPTFDPALVVDRPRIVALRSDDGGATWASTTMLRLHPDGGTAEAWLTELSDGRLFGACWAMDLRTGADLPNPYALSPDGGATWSPTRSTGLRGQAVGMAALLDGRVAVVYNQRDPGRAPVGVWLAVLRPTADDPGVEADVPVWAASEAAAGTAAGATATTSAGAGSGAGATAGTSAAAMSGPSDAATVAAQASGVGAGGDVGHDAWQTFTFGEPGIVCLSDGDLLVTIWSGVPGSEGVVSVRVRSG